MKGINRNFLLLVMALSMPGLLFAAGTQDKKEIKIGVICPMTGDTAFLGEQMSELVRYVDKEINDSGGINGMKVNIIMEDDAGVSAGAARATQKLTSIDNVNVIIGPLFTPCVLAAKPIVESAKVPLITATSNHKDIFSENGFVFSIDSTDELASKNYISYLSKVKGFRRLSLMGSYNDQTLEMIRLLKEFWPGNIAAESTFNSGTEDFRTELTKIKNAGTDALWLGADSEELGRIIRQMTELGMNDVFIATDYQAVRGTFMADFGSVVDGRFCYTSMGGASSDPQIATKLDKFLTGYRNMFRSDPDPFLQMYYDTFIIAFEALKKGGYSGTELRNAISKTDRVMGINDYYSFDSLGQCIGTSLLVEYRNGKIEVVQKMP